MFDHNLDGDLRSAGRRIRDLSHRVVIDPTHKARLREELLRRHQELLAEDTQRAAGTLWSRLSGLKRLTLVAPPALAAALALSVFVWSLQIWGHQPTTAAEAARLTQALARTVPTVTSWQWTVHRHGAEGGVIREQSRLTSDRELYIRDGKPYLYLGGRWAVVTSGQSTWQWAFATLPSHLLDGSFNLVGKRTIAGHETEGIRYDVSGVSGQDIVATAWVDESTGLLVQLNRAQVAGTRVIQRETIDYRYRMSP
jgi:hypothetical protein